MADVYGTSFMADLQLCNEFVFRIPLSILERLGKALDRLKVRFLSADVRGPRHQFNSTPPAQSGQSPDASRWKFGSITEAKSCQGTRRTVLGRFLMHVKKHAFHLVGNVEVSDARIAYPSNCFVLGFHHHYGSQLPAAVMAPSAVIRPLLGLADCRGIIFMWQCSSSSCGSAHHLCTGDARTPINIAGNGKKDPVPSLVPLLPCFSVVIITYEAKFYTKTQVGDGWVCWSRWVSKLLIRLKCGSLV